MARKTRQTRKTEEWIDDLGDALLCRDTALGHDWKLQPIVDKAPRGGFIRYFYCARCDSLKDQFLDAQGYPVKSRPKYQKNYLRPAGSGRMTKDDNAAVRLKVIERYTQ